MANISSARGTLTLQGPWNAEDIALFIPVLDTWQFHGQYGIQSYYTKLSVQHMSTDFDGCGRWSFSGTVESFDEWTRDWIRNEGTLTQEQYDSLLRIMQKKDLSIHMEFDDEEEGVGFNIHETGVLTSDGECLSYEVLSHGGQQSTWQELGWRAFRKAVLFFSGFVSNPDEFKIRKWVKRYVLPMRGVRWGYDAISLILLEEEDVLNNEILADFASRFHPDTEAWNMALRRMNLSPDIFKDKLEPLREVVAGLTDIRQVAVSAADMVWFLHRDGTVSSVSGGVDGGIRYPCTDVQEIAAAQSGVILRKENGTVDGCLLIPGEEDGNTLVPVNAWSDVAAVAAGGVHVVALKRNGTVAATGASLPGVGICEVEGWRDVAAISANAILTVGLRKDGTVLVTPIQNEEVRKHFGFDFSGWRDIQLLAVGAKMAVGLQTDGCLQIQFAGSDHEEVSVKEWEDEQPFTALAVGLDHLLGLRPDGTVFAAYLQDVGQCDGVDDWTDIVSIAAGGNFSFGVKADGTVVMAGSYQEDNDYLNDLDEEFEFPKGDVSLEDEDDEYLDDEDEEQESDDPLYRGPGRKSLEKQMGRPFDQVEQVILTGSTFVLTGRFWHCGDDREKIQSLIAEKGGRTTGAVSGKTTYLVIGDLGDFGLKKVEQVDLQNAKGKNVKIIGEEELFQALEGGE